MFNVGFVLYTKGEDPGTLDARWCHPWFGQGTFGTGKATGGPAEGYAGRYHIQYFAPDGSPIAGFELAVEKEGEYYTLAWIDNREVLDRGVGMEMDNGLAAGWRRVSDTPPAPFETHGP